MKTNGSHQEATQISITPLFRWAGSKRKILPTLADYWTPGYARYVEPFAGSASLFFRLQPSRALLGDINADLIEAYEIVRERPDDVYKAVVRIPRTENDYYLVRGKNPRRMSPFGRAVRFVYLNRYCFNGIFRTNSAGTFNVPYAHKKPGVIPPIERFRVCAALLSRATLRCSDFGRLLSNVRKGDFVYLDPPYAVESRRVFREYDRRAFTKKDLERLGEHLKRLDSDGASFLLSYADCSEARTILKSWVIRRIRVRRHVAGFAAARRTGFELLVTNVDRARTSCPPNT